MKPYPKYKDSGVEWIGEVPEGWESYRLSRTITKITNGYVGPTRGIMQPSGVPYIQGIHIKNGTIQFTPTGDYYVDEEWSNNHLKSILREKDLLVVQTGNIGEVGLVPSDFDGANCHALIILRTREEMLEPNYLLFYLLSPIGSFLLQRIKTGEILYHINCTKLRDIKVIVPPYPEQTAIANYLDRKTAEIDRLIANKERLIELYEEEKTAVINQAVTKGLDPDAPMKSSGIDWLGDIPEHWEVKRLKYAIESIAGGGTPSTGNPSFWNGTIPWVSPKDMKVAEIFETEDYVTELAIKDSSTNLIPPERVLVVVRSGILKHTFPVAINKVPVCLNQDMKAMKPVDWISVQFFYWKLMGMEKEILTLCNKMGATVDSIEISNLMDLILTFPALAEQTAIVQHIETQCHRLDTIIEKFKKQIELLKEYRTTLISEVVTGKIDVRDEVVQ